MRDHEIEEHTVTTKSVNDLFSGMERFQVDKNDDKNKRRELNKRFCDKLRTAINNPKDPLTDALVAIKMSHLTEDELRDTFYDMEKKARNFIAYWKWCFMQKK